MREAVLGRKFAISILLSAMTLGIGACSNKETNKPASQVAAKVNSEEISVHQINFVLSRNAALANVSADNAPLVRREVLNKLIDQQLAVEQAVKQKLDRSPEVLMAIEAARNEILARAYIEQIARARIVPTEEEARKYYADNPALFAERRIYSIQEIVLPPAVHLAPQLREMLNAGKSMTELSEWLKTKDIKFTGASATRPAEQIPLELLPKIHALSDGQGIVLEGPQNLTVMRVLSSQSAPISEEAALKRIQMFLGNLRATEAAERELKDIKSKATISYMGEFAETANVSNPPASTAKAPTDTNAVIEKGAASLK